MGNNREVAKKLKIELSDDPGFPLVDILSEGNEIDILKRCLPSHGSGDLMYSVVTALITVLHT